MIDFPASPIDGQVFSATNGVVYKYSATYSSWLAQNPTPPLGGTGDFNALRTTALSLTGSPVAYALDSVVSGNAGAWFNAANGRYTPPAGRYCLRGSMNVFNSGGTAGSAQIELRKNGAIALKMTGTTASGSAIPLMVEANLDANGSDYFEIWAWTAASAGVIGDFTFKSFPLTGMQGPTGGAPGPVVGDFCANQTSSFPTLTGTMTTLVLTQVATGNSGGYYNTTTGRYTPPAGRYLIEGGYSAWASGAAAATFGVALYKNGVQQQVVYDTGATTGNYGNPFVSMTLDANGTDYFEIRGNAGGSGPYTFNALYFQAFPTQGMVGPQGPTGPAGSLGNGLVTAINGTFSNSVGAINVITNYTLQSGNTGSWLNLVSGRYTPPAGKYFIQCSTSIQAPSGGNGTVTLGARKNAVGIGPTIIGSGQALFAIPMTIGLYVDANGTDIFDFYMTPGTAGMNAQGNAAFTAFQIG
jgi:hypothetical protein